MKKIWLFLIFTSCSLNVESQSESETLEFRENITDSLIFEKNPDSEEIFSKIQKEALKNLDWKIEKLDSNNVNLNQILKLVSKPKEVSDCKDKISPNGDRYNHCCDSYYYHSVIVGICCDYYIYNKTGCYKNPWPSPNDGN